MKIIMNNYYLIEFNSQDQNLQAAGFEICLALVTLDLPLNILIDTTLNDLLLKQLGSLNEYGSAVIHHKNNLNETQYNLLTQSDHFSLCF
jgi:hypothetical protein